MRRKKVKRHKLRHKGVYVVATSFGGRKGRYRVGKVIGYTSNVAIVAFKDEHGEYEWRFSLHSGIRTQDIHNSDGWRISLTDLDEWKPPAVTVKLQNRVALIHEEVSPFSSEFEDIIWRVYRDQKNGRLYFKTCRRNRKTGRERPTTVPIEKILEVLGEFVLNWE